MLMAHVLKAHLQDYWSRDSLISTTTFPKYMTRDRYILLSRFIHFADNNYQDVDDRLWKIRPVMKMVLKLFSKYFKPNQKLVIDESLVLFKGRLIFKQYIQTKRHKFGIKLFVCCDCKSGMVLDLIIYTGTGVDIDVKDELGISGAVVKALMDPYLDAARILYTDIGIPALHSRSSCTSARLALVALFEKQGKKCHLAMIN